MSFSQEIISHIALMAAWSSFYLPTIQLITSLTCAAIALVILMLRREILVDERWARYFGWAFMIFAVQYILQTFANWYLGWGYAPQIATRTSLGILKHIAHTAGSILNNLLFLASARALMGHRWLPRWVWAFAAVTAGAAFLHYEFWRRLPDMTFSAVCLFFLGWAMYVNFRSARRRRVAWINLFGGGLYAAVHLLFAFNPVIVTQRWAWPLIDAIGKKQLSLQMLRPNSPVSIPLDGLDALVFGIAFLLKILLFVGALLLIMKSLLALAPAEEEVALGKVINGHKEYLHHETLLRALGESVDAELAVLCYRLPGVDTNRVAWWRWLRDPASKPLTNPEFTTAPSAETWAVGKVLATGEQESSPNIPKDRKKGPIVYYPFVPGMRAFVVTAVKYQGAVIGALNVEWRHERSYTSTAKKRLKQLAADIAPTVNARRQLIALNQISKELRDCERLEGGLSQHNLEKILFAIQRNLNPIASGFYFAAGFERIGVAMDRRRELEQFSMMDSWNAYRHAFRRYAQKTSESLSVLLAPLDAKKLEIGSLVLALEHDRDGIAEATMGRDRVQRRSVASTLFETLLVSARNHFEEMLRRLQTSFDDSPAITIDFWCRNICETCREAGIREAVAVFADGEYKRLSSTKEFEDYVRTTVELLGDGAAADTPEIPSLDNLPDGGMLIPLKIRRARAVLWLRAEQGKFGWERTEASPWKYFLEELAQIADAAFSRMEQDRLRLETARLVLLGDVASLMFHDVKHKAGDVSGSTLLVENAVRFQDMKAVAERVAMVKEHAENLNRVAERLLQPLTLDSRPAVLKDVVEQNVRLEPQFIGDVSLDVQVPPDYISSIPGVIIALAINSVVTNAIEALKPRLKKAICIEAASQGDDILLHITDSGPGVPPGKRPNLFTRKTPAKSAGHGIGLPLACSALRQSNGDIYLDPQSRDGWNRFTIQLPRLMKENEA
jgi:signal transduction histidine kinase